MQATLIITVLVLMVVVAYLVIGLRQARRDIESLWRLNGKRSPAPRGSTRLSLAMLAISAASGLAVTDEAAASLDRQKFPPSQWGYLYYYSTAGVDDAVDRGALDVAMRLVVPSMSRQPVLERCLPVQVTPTCYRIDLADLGWDATAWGDLVGRHPYALEDYPLVVRADWLLVNLTDAHESDAYYRLLFGGKAPKTRDEALKILGVDATRERQFGMIEGASGVSVQGVRLIRNLPALRGYAWGTNDVLALDSEQDPLEQPENDFAHDGEEWIIGLPKVHLESGTRGALQCYFLANGQGNIVDRAPVDLVVDHLETRGVAEIRNAVACFGCHARGINEPTANDLRNTIAAGVEAWSDYAEQQQIEAFHFADLTKEIRRNNEDYAAIVKLACGVEPTQAAGYFRDAVRRYDAPLDLTRAAFELRCPPDELKLALALASANGVKLTARLSGLAHGRTVPRAAWETHFNTVRSIYETWKDQR